MHNGTHGWLKLDTITSSSVSAFPPLTMSSNVKGHAGRCRAMEDIACDVDEVLWPKPPQRHDAEAEWIIWFWLKVILKSNFYSLAFIPAWDSALLHCYCFNVLVLYSIPIYVQYFVQLWLVLKCFINKVDDDKVGFKLYTVHCNMLFYLSHWVLLMLQKHNFA